MADPDDAEQESHGQKPGWKARRTEAERRDDPDSWEAATDWVKAKWKGKASSIPDCPYCGASEWWVGSPVVLATVTGIGSSPPLFPVTCINCGQTVFVNAILAGLESDTEASNDA